MSRLVKDELGFVRARAYGRTSREELGQILDVDCDEEIYRSTVENGSRTSKRVSDEEVRTNPGDTFSVVPRVKKAAPMGSLWSQLVNKKLSRQEPQASNGTSSNQRLLKEIAALKRAGYGWIEPPSKTEWGWMVRMKGVVLPGGVRTDAMVLLSENYPLVAPIGFYVRKGAHTSKLDASHLFKNGAYHGAVDLSEHGWQWYCGIAEGWKPGKHTLVSYLNIVFMLFNEDSNKGG